MSVLVVVVLSAVGFLFGVAVGWFGQRRAWTWCTQCGGALGTTCVDCRDRERAATRRLRSGDEAAYRASANSKTTVVTQR
jgi:hypothetical protein